MGFGFPHGTLQEYRVFVRCCSELAKRYEELARVCPIDSLVVDFDQILAFSYCQDQFSQALSNVSQGLDVVRNGKYGSNAELGGILSDIRDALLKTAADWDLAPPLQQCKDVGRGLARAFYTEGSRAPSLLLMDSVPDPNLVLSNVSLSDVPAGEADLPMYSLPDGIHVPFTKDFDFSYYLSYPFHLLHEYVSHWYVPSIDCDVFCDGWMLFAAELFLATRWSRLCRQYPLFHAQLRVLQKTWLPRLGYYAQRGYELASGVQAVAGDNDAFLQITWDLASLASKHGNHLSFHTDFIDLVGRFVTSGKVLVLQSAVNTGNAIAMFEKLKASPP